MKGWKRGSFFFVSIEPDLSDCLFRFAWYHANSIVEVDWNGFFFFDLGFLFPLLGIICSFLSYHDHVGDAKDPRVSDFFFPFFSIDREKRLFSDLDSFFSTPLNSITTLGIPAMDFNNMDRNNNIFWVDRISSNHKSIHF